MPTAAFTTLGCKVNQYETQRILDDFEARGFAITEFTAPADLYVINTCSVTQAAERKSRYMVRKLARQNPDALVVMTGCYGEMAQIKGETVEDAALVVPNHQKLETLAHVLRAFPHLETALAGQPPAPPRPYTPRTRATIKVQDGCNVFCAFCSIPYTRKFMLSRTTDDILAEAARRVEQGYREIVITGVLVGAYGQDNFTPIAGRDLPRGAFAPRLDVAPAPASKVKTNEEGLSEAAEKLSGQTPSDGSQSDALTFPTPIANAPDLADLLRQIARVPGVARVRLSSIEPTQVTDSLLEAFASEPKLCRHLHIPLQSGDSGILRAMNRPYDQEFYLERCRAAYAALPDLAITSDIMVGFPGEDRPAFENTLAVVRAVGYARAHLFRYSPRPNTPAAEFAAQVSEAEKEARSKELGDACRATQRAFIARHLGRELEVLVENKEGAKRAASTSNGEDTGNADHEPIAPSGGEILPGLLSGYTSNYIRVQFTGGSHLIGAVVNARLLEPTSDGALGEVGSAHFGPLEAPPDADFLPLATFAAQV